VRSETRSTSPVTGLAAYVGPHLVEALLARGCPLIVLDSLSTGVLSNLEPVAGRSGFRFAQGSVLDEVVVDPLTNQCDTVIHLAAAVGVKLVVEQPLRSLTADIRGYGVVKETAIRGETDRLAASPGPPVAPHRVCAARPTI